MLLHNILLSSPNTEEVGGDGGDAVYEKSRAE